MRNFQRRKMGIIVCEQIVAVTVRSLDMRPVKDVNLLRLGEAIRTFRSKRGWTQEEFAYQCGLDRSYVGGIERGERNISLKTLCKIAAALKLDIPSLTKGLPSEES